jgi:hypothetical protein
MQWQQHWAVIDAYIRSALLIQGRHAPGSWQTVAELSLGKP